MGVYKKIKKNLIFRLGLKKKEGLGHFLRCLKIFYKIKHKYNCIFVIDKISEDLQTRFNEISFLEIYKKDTFFSQNLDADKFMSMTKNIRPAVIIIDDYRLNKIWHKKVKKKYNKIIAIDDLSSNEMYCDYYVNYKLNLEQKRIQIEKINKKNTKLLLGINYCLIGNKLERKNSRKFKKNLIINFGNSFNFNTIKKNLREIFKLNQNIFICIGIFSINYEYIIEESKKNKNIKIIRNQISIDHITSEMDLFIGSAGNAIYENSYLKLPSIFFSLTNNQKNNIDEFKLLGHQFYLEKNELTNTRVIFLVKLILQNIDEIKKSYQKINLIKKYNINNLIRDLKL